MDKIRHAGYSGLSEHLYAFKQSGQQYSENSKESAVAKLGYLEPINV